MPLLPLEQYLFPEDLLDNACYGEAGPARWWALHTRPRAEKSLARKFLGRALPFFLPLYRRQWRHRGRVMCSYMPLFPGYIFLHGDNQARLNALATNLVARCLPVEDPAQLQADLARVHHLIAGGAALTPESRLQPGQQVKIISGSMAGLEGTVLRRGAQLKFYVEVRMLQQGVSVEIESWMIEPTGQKQPVGR